MQNQQHDAHVRRHRDVLHSLISDVSKEINGVRFRLYLPNWSTEELQAEADELLRRADIVFEENKRAQLKAIDHFENKVAELILCGAANRKDAIRWLVVASDSCYGLESVEYTFNLPYGYLTGENNAQ